MGLQLFIKMLKNKGYEIEINQHCLQNQKDLLIEYYKKNEINALETDNGGRGFVNMGSIKAL